MLKAGRRLTGLDPRVKRMHFGLAGALQQASCRGSPTRRTPAAAPVLTMRMMPSRALSRARGQEPTGRIEAGCRSRQAYHERIAKSDKLGAVGVMLARLTSDRPVPSRSPGAVVPAHASEPDVLSPDLVGKGRAAKLGREEANPQVKVNGPLP
jgi:hypothetical protein